MASKKEEVIYQKEYAQTTFKITQARNSKNLTLEKIKPPPGGRWGLVNFHPIPSVEPMSTFFVCIWERVPD